MLKLPMISFIVTSYNYSKYIMKTLESIKCQTYDNFEIIVVDDCSSDNSVEIIENFISENQDLRITLIKQDTNQGQLASMLNGLKIANGQFVSFIDSDDIVLPDYAFNHIRVHLQTSVAFTSCQITEIGENDEIHTFCSNSSPTPDKKDVLEQVQNDLENKSQTVFKIVKKHFGGWYWSPNSSAMFRKAAIEIVLNYKNTDAWKICPDKFLFNFAHLIGGSAIIFKPLVGYRRHKNNVGNCTLVTGNKRLHSDKTTLINIKNNLKLRPETIKFLWQERKNLGYRSTLNLIRKVIF